MTVPGRLDAARLLRSMEPSEWFLRHSCAVADIATWLATRIRAEGHPIDVHLVAAAALLHDVDKLFPGEERRRLRHGEGSAAWLAARGHGELGPLVRDHPVTRLADGAAGGAADGGDEGPLTGASLEAKVVAYADKRAGQRLEPMAVRFASWRRRYPPGSNVHVKRTGGSAWDEATFALVEARAKALEVEVCAAAGVRPEQVRRLRWSRRALTAAG